VKRFWRNASAVERDCDWGIELDGKSLRTPAREPLVVQTFALAEAIAEEWNSAGEDVDPRDMPLTGLANAAIDRVGPDRQAFAAGLARYAEGDLSCYRAEGPDALVERQSESWDSLLGWARRRFDVDFKTTSGILHVDQPPATVDRLTHAVGALRFAWRGYRRS
jgi:chaperone required for assembly of F1-ATPase